MDNSEVNKSLLGELEAMGFPVPRATKALHLSGNSSLEAAIDWIVDHENDQDIDEMPLVAVNIDIETPKSSYISEQATLKARELRDGACKKKEGEEKKLEREREKDRIRAGKELLEAKKIAEENERKRLLASRKAEKEEEKRAREKIRQKLQQDKVERGSKRGLSLEGSAYTKSATPLMPEKNESMPVAPTALPVKFATTVELMRDCLRSLRRQHKDDDAKVKKAFQTLLIYVRNIANNPDEGKFRKIRLSNPAFQDRVGTFKEGIEFLELCGFEIVEGGKFLFIPGDKIDIAVLKSAGDVLHSGLTNPFFGLLSR